MATSVTYLGNVIRRSAEFKHLYERFGTVWMEKELLTHVHSKYVWP